MHSGDEAAPARADRLDSLRATLDEADALLLDARMGLRRVVYEHARAAMEEGEEPVMVRHMTVMGLIGEDGDDRAFEALADDVEDAIAGRPFDEGRGPMPLPG